MVKYKVCRDCGAKLPATSIYFPSNGPKLKAKCRPCQREYNKLKQRANREEQVESFGVRQVVQDAVDVNTSEYTQQFTKKDGGRVVTFINSYPQEFRTKKTMIGYQSSLANIMEASG